MARRSFSDRRARRCLRSNWLEAVIGDDDASRRREIKEAFGWLGLLDEVAGGARLARDTSGGLISD